MDANEEQPTSSYLPNGLVPSDVDDAIPNPDPPRYRDDAVDDDASIPPIPFPNNQRIKPTKRKLTFLSNPVIRLTILLFCLVVLLLVVSNSPRTDGSVDKFPMPTKSLPPPSASLPAADLDLVEIYPKLDENRSTPECRAAWHNLTAVPCNELIWAPNWDEGVGHTEGPPPDKAVVLICTAACTDALLEAQKLVGPACAGQKAFITEDYTGKIHKMILEDDPAQIIDVLVERVQHMCRKSPIGDAEGGFCVSDMWSQWRIIDGFQSDGLLGLESFKLTAQTSRTEPAGLKPVREGWDEWSTEPRFREERRFGSGRNSTTCSWCTIQWFKKRIGMWSKDKMEDERSLSLPEFLRMWEAAGMRCEGPRFGEIYKSAIESYTAAGVLEEGWNSGTSDSYPYMMWNGPSDGSFPLVQAKAALSTLVEDHNETTGNAPTPESPHFPGISPNGEVTTYANCLETFVKNVPGLPCYPFLSFDLLKTHLLSSPATARALCANPCLSQVKNLLREMQWVCSVATYGNWDTYDKGVSARLGKEIPFSMAEIFGFDGTITSYLQSCTQYGGIQKTPCGAIYAQWGTEEWLLPWKKPDIKHLIRITRQQLKVLPEFPEVFKTHSPNSNVDPPTEIRRIWAERMKWEKMIEEGVCSSCMWRQYVLDSSSLFEIKNIVPDISAGEDVAIQWLKTVHLLRDNCRARGMRMDERRIIEIDEAWTRYVFPTRI
jgi:hypothetical protein